MVGNSTTPICQYSMSTFYCLQNISGEVSSFHVWIFFVDNFQESLVLVLILYDQSFKMSQIHQIYLRKDDILKLPSLEFIQVRSTTYQEEPLTHCMFCESLQNITGKHIQHKIQQLEAKRGKMREGKNTQNKKIITYTAIQGMSSQRVHPAHPATRRRFANTEYWNVKTYF